MQIEKFYLAKDLRRVINEIETLIKDIEAGRDIMSLNSSVQISVEVSNLIKNKTKDVIKRELTKIVKLKEKEFIDL